MLWGADGLDWEAHKNDVVDSVRQRTDYDRKVQKALNNFFFEVKRRWKAAKNHLNRFLHSNKDWLAYKYSFPYSRRSLAGRPKTDLGEATFRTKANRTTEIRKRNSI